MNHLQRQPHKAPIAMIFRLQASRLQRRHLIPGTMIHFIYTVQIINNNCWQQEKHIIAITTKWSVAWYTLLGNKLVSQRSASPTIRAHFSSKLQHLWFVVGSFCDVALSLLSFVLFWSNARLQDVHHHRSRCWVANLYLSGQLLRHLRSGPAFRISTLVFIGLVFRFREG